MNNLSKIYYLSWPCGAIHAIENLENLMTHAVHAKYGYPAPFHFLSKFDENSLKWVDAILLDSNFKRIEIMQLKAEWNKINQVEKKNAKRKKHRQCMQWKDDGRRHRRKVKTLQERKWSEKIWNEQYQLFEPNGRPKRRHIPCDRSGRYNGMKTWNWKLNRDKQYK
ncbi:hypothetical protein VCHA53O466_40366 [Vibrio chagasii]|nr:hypothetical protein VCHA53O466_40366 [Vibrio chagasii]